MRVNRRRRRVGDARKFLIQRRKHRQNGQERPGRRRFDEELLAFLVHDGTLARKLELPGNPHRLIATVPE